MRKESDIYPDMNRRRIKYVYEIGGKWWGSVCMYDWVVVWLGAVHWIMRNRSYFFGNHVCGFFVGWCLVVVVKFGR